MRYRKFNKYEKKENKRAQVAEAMSGSGVYLFENSANADLTLPRATQSGLRKIGPKQQFQGDSYYMQYVRSGLLRLIQVIQSEETAMQQKLLLDQPDTVTTQGKVEHVVETPTPTKRPLREATKQSKPADVLLNESPVEDGFVIVNE